MMRTQRTAQLNTVPLWRQGTLRCTGFHTEWVTVRAQPKHTSTHKHRRLWGYPCHGTGLLFPLIQPLSLTYMVT